MSGAYFLVFLILGGSVALWAALLLPSSESLVRRAPAPLLLLVYLLPALVLALFLLGIGQEDDWHRLRFALLGIGVRGDASAPAEIVIGGDRDIHGMWVQRLAGEGAAGVIRLSTEAEGGALLAVPESGAPAVVEVDGTPLPRSVALAHGDVLQVGEQAWQVDLEENALRSGERVEPLVGRTAGINFVVAQVELPVSRPYGVRSRTYAVDWLAPEDATLASFLYWEPSFLGSSQLRVALLDPSVHVERGGAPQLGSAELPLEAGARLRVHRLASWDRRELAARGVTDLRSFRVETGDRSLALVFDTPEVHVLRWTDVLALQESGTAAGDAVRVDVTFGEFELPAGSLHFAKVGRRIEVENRALLEFGPAWSKPRSPFGGPAPSLELVSPQGIAQVQEGVPFWLGGHHRAALQIDRISPPVALGFLVLFAAFLKLFAAHAVGLSRTGAVLAAAVEGLVVVRVLTGYRSMAMPPFSSEAHVLGMVSLALLPTALLVAWLPRPGTPGWLGRSIPTLLAAACAGLAFLILESGIGAALWCGLLVVSLVIPLRDAIGGGVRGLAGGVKRLWPGARKQAAASAEAEAKRALGVWRWLAAAALVGLVRIGLVSIGVKESFTLGGQRVSLDLAHIPAVLMLHAWLLVRLWQRAYAGEGLRARDAGLYLAVATLALVIPAVVVSDLGLAILNMWPLLLGLVGLCWGVARLESRGRGMGEFSRELRRVHGSWAAGLALLLFGAAVTVPAVPRAVVTVLPADEGALYDRTYLRMLQFAMPERIQAVGAQASEELATVTAVMRSYAQSPVRGRGYGGSELSASIRDTALRENAPGFLIAAEAGFVGTLGMVALYGALGGVGLALLPWRREYERRHAFDRPSLQWLAALGGLALLALALPSLHMLAANYGQALFTGKNAYFLGLDSRADVIACWLLAWLGSGAAAAVGGEEAA